MHSECHGLEVASRIAEVALFVGPLLGTTNLPTAAIAAHAMRVAIQKKQPSEATNTFKPTHVCLSAQTQFLSAHLS
jgi:hypothetical protein